MTQPENTLDSWKEIAAYFDRTVRTVQNWERHRGLPVHRLGSRVQAFPSELAQWRAQQARPASNLGMRRRALITLGALAFLITVTWMALAPAPWSSTSSALARPPEVFADRIRITAPDAAEYNWEIPTTGLNATWYSGLDAFGRRTDSSPRAGSFLIRQLPGEREPRLWFVARHARDPGTDYLRCYSAEGDLLWEVPAGRPIVEPLPRALLFDSFQGWLIDLIDVAGQPRLLAMAHNTDLYPTRVTLHDPATGAVEEEFWHPGRFWEVKLVDLDGDGVDELLLGGTNNPGLGVGHPALLVLKLPFSAAGVQPVDFFGNRNTPRPWRYRLFSAPDVFLERGIVTYVEAMTVREEQRRLVAELGTVDRMFHVLDFELNPITAYPSDLLNQLHSDFFRDGALTHLLTQDEIEGWGRSLAYEEIPNGNDPALFEQLDGFVNGDWRSGPR